MKRIGLFFMGLAVALTAICAQNIQSQKFQLEIYGGYSGLRPADLNLAVASEENLVFFLKNEYYSYLERINYIESFEKTRTGSYGKIEKALPFGFRIKANVTSALSLSLGVKYLRRTLESYPKDEFSIIENSGRLSQDTLEYSPIMAQIKGVSCLAGIHLGRDFARILRIEGFAATGPIYGEFKYFYLQKNTQFYGDSSLDFYNEYSGELIGKGSCFAYEFGAQLSIKLIKPLSIFIEGTYTGAVIEHLEGPGWMNMFGEPEHWDGDIGVTKEPYYEPWGYKEIKFLSNNPLMLEYYKERDMQLDFTGFSLNIGLTVKLF
jgi:hypothetical protein